MRQPFLSPPIMSSLYNLKVIRLEELKWDSRFHSKSPHLYVEVEVEGESRKSRAIKSRTPSWDDDLAFHVSDQTSKIKIEVKHASRWSPTDPCIGIAETGFAFLLSNSADAEVPLTLLSPNRSSAATGRVFLRLGATDVTSAAAAGIASVGGDVQRPEIVHSADASNGSQSINSTMSQVEKGKLYHAVGKLLERLEKLKGLKTVMDNLSEVHPFVKIAWSSTSALYNAVQNVFEADKKIVDLVQSMADAFEFVQDVQKLRNRAATLQKSIDSLLKQTIECCTFIRRYISRGFVGRMLQTGDAQKVDEFRQSLLGFKREIDSGVILHTAFVSVKAARAIDTLRLLRPSQFDGFDRPVCLPGTRVEIMDKIIQWVFSETNQNIFWLHGVAGSGKSTVSTTIASHLQEMSRLGAFLFFERGKSEPSSVIRTIAYKLALCDSSIGEMISESIPNHDIISTSSIDQFNKLLLHPLSSAELPTPGPVVIVLDALDECGTSETRRGLLSLLRDEFPKLPNAFRFLVTSRQEADIDQALSSCSEFVCEAALDYTSPTSQSDVLSFLHAELDVIRQNTVLRNEWPWEENIGLLGKASGGLFIWASTAVKMVKDGDSPFYDLDALVSSVKSSRSEIDLDELYATVLRNSSIRWEKDRSRDRFARILSLILLSKVPLSTATVDGILGLPLEESSTLILSRLRSVIAYSEGGPIGLLHASFSDYLVSSKPSDGPWFIDLDKANHLIVKRCFTIMKEQLRFNICNLESSFVANDYVPGLADRVMSRIPPHLEYACVYWAQHLIDSSPSSELLGLLSEFAHHRLLFWFEVLSLTKKFARVTVQALSDAAHWSKEPNVSEFLQDARKISSSFATAIMHSTPHIYVSMIPLSEHDSVCAAHYSKYMTPPVRVERIGVKRPLQYLRVFEGHNSVVNSVDFSPNGRQVVSACNDETVRVWDIESGEEIFEPLVGRVACFAPDGGRIVSGPFGSDLRVWDAHNGDLVLGPLKGHSYWVRSIAWSPDGRTIASGSDDKTAILWNAADGKSIFRLCGHADIVRCVAFSPDSSRLASGSDDRTIRIWDVQSGELASEPFRGHSGWVKSVAFSPDGKHVTSGSNDDTIKVWEVGSGSVVLTLEGHTGWVTSVAYSPCGTRIISGSYDKTIRVWDAQSGEIISTLEGHTDIVNSVAVSRDGKFIASGSNDRTVRIWDATIISNSKASTKHSRGIRSVAVSPDGRRIASASYDESVIVWDAQTGDVEFTLHGRVNCVAFVPNGSRLVSGSWDKTVRLWDTETGESASESLMHSSAVICIAVSPDGVIVACGTRDSMISVWSIATGQLVAEPLQGHSDWVNSIAFSPEGRRLASGSRDKKVIIWDTERWEAMLDFLTGHSACVSSVCFSPDGSRIASGSSGDTIIIWDAESRQKVAGPFKGHANTVSTVIFSLDGMHVISGSWDRTILVWDVESEQTICKLGGHSDLVNSLSLSPDGRLVISGASDGTIRMWDLSDILRPSTENMGAAMKSAPEWVLGDNGWILGGRNQHDLLAWIPPDLRETVWLPRNIAILGCEYSTRLDFEGAAIGTRWTQCFTSPSDTP